VQNLPFIFYSQNIFTINYPDGITIESITECLCEIWGLLRSTVEAFAPLGC